MANPFDALAGIPQETDKATKPEPNKDTKISRKISRYQDISQNADDVHFAEAVRVVVKEVGRETSPLRLTAKENEELEDAIYAYKKQGIRTDKTQIERIALNYILNDLRQNGKESILTHILKRVNS